MTSRTCSSAAIALLIALLTACDSDVAPRAGGDYFFSLYGVFNPHADTQAVIVFPVQSTLAEVPTDLGVLVVSEELGSSVRTTWTDSLVSSPDGPVHVFWSDFRAKFGTDYRLTVASERHEGRRSEVLVAVPGLAAIDVRPLQDNLHLTQTVFVGPDTERLNAVTVRYVVQAKLPAAWRVYPTLVPGESGLQPVDPPPGDSLVVQTLFVPISYDHAVEPAADGMQFQIDYHSDAAEIWRRLELRGRRDRSFGVRLLGIELSLTVSSPDWVPPGGTFDREVLIQPGTMSNVEGGFGFVGSGYALSAVLHLGESEQERLGFRVIP
ncbi:MAG: hypothetical protein JJ896_14360 [Rhodothermales bacterium]|nr:hypothetical protein [Rhodothermales bacterium]MBO6780833.1 hypothetical protein [Rhodothermales bacterium]